ncbi:MAG TPA: hypothetical protein VN325_05985 [Steroidobacteraceae bacterium]|nr:hypothetical protein [Steroidobacteraceae bacterium]
MLNEFITARSNLSADTIHHVLTVNTLRPHERLLTHKMLKRERTHFDAYAIVFEVPEKQKHGVYIARRNLGCLISLTTLGRCVNEIK